MCNTLSVESSNVIAVLSQYYASFAANLVEKSLFGIKTTASISINALNSITKEGFAIAAD